mmetsp:Transcript_14899/g.43425  ORF Transcript_14899/g.43425 Transcript_14899/m.43425 type:complete len:206 (+) Transcript_14899:358-975(+)
MGRSVSSVPSASRRCRISSGCPWCRTLTGTGTATRRAGGTGKPPRRGATIAWRPWGTTPPAGRRRRAWTCTRPTSIAAQTKRMRRVATAPSSWATMARGAGAAPPRGRTWSRHRPPDCPHRRPRTRGPPTLPRTRRPTRVTPTVRPTTGRPSEAGPGPPKSSTSARDPASRRSSRVSPPPGTPSSPSCCARRHSTPRRPSGRCRC